MAKQDPSVGIAVEPYYDAQLVHFVPAESNSPIALSIDKIEI